MSEPQRLLVLCCCEPKNELGMAPIGLPYVTKHYIDRVDGTLGEAYVSHGINWDKVEGFLPFIDNKGRKKPRRGVKTWAEPKKKKRKKPSRSR